MKAQDLMIGDWVYGIDGKGGKHPCRINAVDIYPQNRTPRVVTSGGYGYQHENLEPISLTLEILEKNGFNKKESYLATGPYIRYELSCNNYRIVVAPRPSKMWSLECLTITTIPQVRLYIEYVHELQHALRLCGIDKEIVI